MSSMLLDDLKQTKSFASLREEVWVGLQKTSSVLSHVVDRQLRSRGLSLTQYNVLRILRGAGDGGLCQYAIGERLVAQVPDVPRILERMEKAGWVRRERADQDRRMVFARLSASGAALVDELDVPMRGMMDGMFGGVGDAQLQQLNELLGAARTSAEQWYPAPSEPRK